MAELLENVSAGSAGQPTYRDEVLEIEPHGLEHIRRDERHGHPFSLFTLWFAANLVLATWVIGNLAVGVFGESMHGALLALLIGNVLGGLALGAVSTFGPRLGVPQMVQSRAAFGFLGNFGPGGLTYLAGIGWFAVNTVYGAYALVTLTGLNYFIALVILVIAQVILAIYGHNMIHLFERIMSVALGVVFTILTVFTFVHANFNTPFNAKAPVPFGGEVGGFIITVGLALSYYLGWLPYASDYSRYLPENTKPSRVILFTFLGSFIPCLVLEWVGALTVSIFPNTQMTYTDQIAHLMPGVLAGVALISIALGTAAANSLNIYSGAMSALVVHADVKSWTKAIVTGAIFGAAAAALLLVSNATLAGFQEDTIPGGYIVLAALALCIIIALVVRFPLKRWQAALLVGVFGGILSIAGSNPTIAEQDYSNFLLLLAYWVTPWLAVVMVDWYFKHRQSYQLLDLYDQTTRIRAGAIAWIVGLAVSIPFWNQTWYVGPIPTNWPQVGDLSYFVGFIVAAVIYFALGRAYSGKAAKVASGAAATTEVAEPGAAL